MTKPGDQGTERFRKLLDEGHDWPADYTFKFIVPAEHADRVRVLFGHIDLLERPSRSGKYLSVTARLQIHSSDEVLAIYKQAASIPGVIAL